MLSAEIPHFLWNPNVHKSLVPTPNQLNRIHTFTLDPFYYYPHSYAQALQMLSSFHILTYLSVKISIEMVLTLFVCEMQIQE